MVLVYEGHEMALARGILSLIMPVDTIVVVVVAGLAVEYHGPADRERGGVGIYIVGLEE